VGIIELLFLSVGLSMDAFAISLTSGMCKKDIRLPHALLIGFMFGFFQAIMPAIGYVGGSFFYVQIKAVDHWVVLIILVFLGVRMIVESIHEMNKNSQKSDETQIVCGTTSARFSFKELVVQSFATSVDALAVGISLAIIDAPLVFCASVIGLVTFCICFPAVYAGKKAGALLSDKAGILGGVMLILIGIKIFLEHLLEK
jgi:putative Mn2+ efflux pump MntP